MPAFLQAFGTRLRDFPSRFADTWHMEYVAACLSLATMAAIIGTSVAYNGQDVAN